MMSFFVFYDFNNYRYSKQYDSNNKCHWVNFQFTKTNEEKPKKTIYQTYAQASLKFQKEPPLDDSFWIVGVQTNYCLTNSFKPINLTF